MGIIIFGASGAGSTTLGKEIAKRLNLKYLDIDDYLWSWETKIPYTVVCPLNERTERLINDIRKHPKFVISGTIFYNSELFENYFDLAVFVSTPAEVCAERVYKREKARWGERVLPGGDMYKSTRFHGDFSDYIANSQKYETADVSKFGRKLHEKWIADLPCPVLNVDGMKEINENTEMIINNYQIIIKEKRARPPSVVGAS